MLALHRYFEVRGLEWDSSMLRAVMAATRLEPALERVMSLCSHWVKGSRLENNYCLASECCFRITF